MRRRQFLALLGSMAIGCPAEVVAQKPDRVRRIGVLMSYTSGHVVGLRRAKIFTQALQDLGWTEGQNIRIDYRWPASGLPKGFYRLSSCLAQSPFIHPEYVWPLTPWRRGS
jgi:hypothetical protein